MLRSFIFITLCSFFLIGCDPHDGKLVLVNNSEDTVFYDLEITGDSITTYPVTKKNGIIDPDYSSMIAPKDEKKQLVMDTWEYFINERCKDSTLFIFFFSNDLIKTAGKDSIMKYQLYSKKFALKVKDMERLHWRVVYE